MLRFFRTSSNLRARQWRRLRRLVLALALTLAALPAWAADKTLPVPRLIMPGNAT